MNKAREFDQSVVAELKALLGDRVSTSAAVREHHGKDESYFPYALPDAVVFVKTTEEVRDVVNICQRHRVPMIPFGVGTSLEGHILAVQGGVSIDLSRMNKVLAVHEADLDKVVLADGRVIQTSRRSKKSAAGYDLTRLFVGSEGTLGIITEVAVRLYPVQEAMSAAVCAFDSVDGCTNTVIATIQSGIPIARCDIVCDKTIDAINRYKKTDYRVAPTVFFEFHGSKSSVVEQAEAVQAIAREHGGKDFQWATKPEERNQ